MQSKSPLMSKKSKIDKLIMGAIIGGAIGSVIGVTLAPKSGKETRKMLKEKGKDVYKKGQELKTKLMEERQEKAEDGKAEKLISALRRLANLFKKRPEENKNDDIRDEMREIPEESVSEETVKEE